MQIDKEEVQKDIPAKQLEDEEISGDMRAQLRRELGGILERWGSDRCEEADQKERPLLESAEWAVVEAGYDAARCENHLDTQAQNRITAKWKNWRAKSTEKQWDWLEALNLYHRRRPVLDITEELGGKRRKRSYRILAAGEKEEI